jgi:hypothetical protein
MSWGANAATRPATNAASIGAPGSRAEHYAAELEAMNVEAIVRHAEGLPPLTYRLTYEGDVLTTSPILEPT